jgi:hypothetical protein
MITVISAANLFGAPARTRTNMRRLKNREESGSEHDALVRRERNARAGEARASNY